MVDIIVDGASVIIRGSDTVRITATIILTMAIVLMVTVLTDIIHLTDMVTELDSTAIAEVLLTKEAAPMDRLEIQ